MRPYKKKEIKSNNQSGWIRNDSFYCMKCLKEKIDAKILNLQYFSDHFIYCSICNSLIPTHYNIKKLTKNEFDFLVEHINEIAFTHNYLSIMLELKERKNKNA